MPSKSNRKNATVTEHVAATADATVQAPDTSPVSTPMPGTPALPPTAPDTAATRGVWAALVAQPGSTVASLADAAGISRPTAAKALASLEKAGLVTRTEGGREGSKRLPDQWQPIPTEESDLPDGGAADVPDPVPTEMLPVVEAGEAATQEKDEPERGENPELADARPAEQPEAEEVESAKQAGTPEDGERESADSGESNRRRKCRAPAPAEKPAATTAQADTGKSRLGSGQLRDMVLQFLRDHPEGDFSPTAMGKVLARSSGAISNACDRLHADGAITRTSDKPRKFRIAAKS